jgi:mannose-6-phosphate isomerase-like protein (cupin superfamily)
LNGSNHVAADTPAQRSISCATAESRGAVASRLPARGQRYEDAKTRVSSGGDGRAAAASDKTATRRTASKTISHNAARQPMMWYSSPEGKCGTREHDVMATERKWFIRNIAEVPWHQFPDHFGGALSKPLVMPGTAGSQHIDYRISMYQPMAYVKVHRHKVQEQVYHVLEGEGLMEIDGANHVVRRHDYIFLPPGVDHSISNTGLVDLVFLVVTSPVTDDVK